MSPPLQQGCDQIPHVATDVQPERELSYPDRGALPGELRVRRWCGPLRTRGWSSCRRRWRAPARGAGYSSSRALPVARAHTTAVQGPPPQGLISVAQAVAAQRSKLSSWRTLPRDGPGPRLRDEGDTERTAE